MSWGEILETWPDGAFHHLVDLLPDRVALPWSVLCAVSDVAIEDWYNDISAESVLIQTGMQPRISKWVGQRYTEEELRQLRENPKQIVTYMMCQHESVFYYSAEMTQLLRTPMLFNRDIQRVRIVIGQQQISAQPLPPVIAPNRTTYVFFVTRGPSVSHVESYEGDPMSVVERVVDARGVWAICSKPVMGKKEVDTPLSLRATWLQWTYLPASRTDFLSVDYYARNMNAYAVWSYGMHTQQMVQAFLNLPRTVQLVLPGDGIGIGASLWRGMLPPISGDITQGVYSHKLTKKEDFLSTMRRGQESGAQDKVLILAYVVSLMNADERSLVQCWDGPVIVIDSKDSCSLPSHASTLEQWKHVGPGVFTLKMPLQWSPQVTVTEDAVRVESVPFSENLVAIPAIAYLDDNMSVQYWKKMRPLGVCVRWSPTCPHVLVCHTLAEMLRFRSKYGDRTVYLGVIGRFVSEADESFVCTLNNILMERIVYRLPLPHWVVPTLKKISLYFLHEDFFYFTIPSLKRSQNVLVFSEEMRANVSFSFTAFTQVKRTRVEYVGLSKNKVWTNTSYGLVGWSTIGALRQLIIAHYFRNVFPNVRMNSVLGKTYDQILLSDHTELTLEESIIFDSLSQHAEKLLVDEHLLPLRWSFASERSKTLYSVVMGGLKTTDELSKYLTIGDYYFDWKGYMLGDQTREKQGVKDDGLGGFAPYGQTQGDSRIPTLVELAARVVGRDAIIYGDDLVWRPYDPQGSDVETDHMEDETDDEGPPPLVRDLPSKFDGA